MISTCNALSKINTVALDNTLNICIQKPLWILEILVVLLHNLSAYNSVLARYKVYLSHPRECLYTRLRYGEAYIYVSIDPPLSKEPYKKVNLSYQIVNPTFRGKLD